MPPRQRATGGLAGAGLLAAVAFSSPALAAMAAPFALLLVVALASHHPPSWTVGIDVDRARAVEGDTVTVTTHIGSDRPVDRVEVLLVAPPQLAVDRGANPAAVGLHRSRHRSLAIVGQVQRWGALPAADVVLRARDRFGFFVHESRFTRPVTVRVYPTPEAVRQLVRPLDTQVLAGNQTARAKAEGIEFADVRPFSVGDRMRDVNWRVTARQGTPWVNQRHPDRNAEVVLFVDTFAEAHLDDAVRAASVLANRYLLGRDRVGLVSFGGTVRWLAPGGGARQIYRIADALVESQSFENLADKSIDVLPGRVLPPKALVLALTPLEDQRVVDALVELRQRGRDVAVIEIEPGTVERPSDEELALRGAALTDRAAGWRLWQLERRSVRDRLQQLGVAVVVWPEAADAPGAPGAAARRAALDAVGEGLRACRRRIPQAG
jgi:uncharacterized protein (DUF58 family)